MSKRYQVIDQMSRKKNNKRQPTAEDRARSADNKLRIYASKSAIEMANNDPGVMRQMLAHIYGFDLPDEAEIARRKLLATIDKKAIQKIEENPAYASDIADRRIRQILLESGLMAEGEEWPKRRPTLDDFIAQIEKVNRIKEMIRAGQPGWLEKLMSPENLTAIISMFEKIISKRESHTTTGEVVWVKIDGENTLIPREQLETFKANWNAQPMEIIERKETANHGKGNETESEPDAPVEAKEKDRKENMTDSDN